MPKPAAAVGQTVYLVESGRRIREAVVCSRSGDLYTVRFADTGGGIRVRGGPALSHPGGRGGKRAAAEGGAPAHPPRLLAQRALVAVLNELNYKSPIQYRTESGFYMRAVLVSTFT